MTLTGKTILITGGTSRLGSAFVREALQRGARIFFTYHQNTTLAKSLIDAGARGFPLNLIDMKAIEEFVKAFKVATRDLDVLIHNAACVRDHTIQNMTEEEWDTVLTADLKAPYFLTKKLLPLLFRSSFVGARRAVPLQRASRKIFFITSRAAVSGGVGISNYSAAKAGLIGLTKSLAQELGKKEILVNAVNPGFMKSSMTENLPEAVIQANREASPLGRISDPEEVAEFLIYLSSDRMTQVTGQVFHFESRKIV